MPVTFDSVVELQLPYKQLFFSDAANILGTTSYAVNELTNVNVTYENALAVANYTLTSNEDNVGDLVQMSNVASNKKKRALKHLSACIFENNRLMMFASITSILLLLKNLLTLSKSFLGLSMS